MTVGKLEYHDLARISLLISTILIEKLLKFGVGKKYVIVTASFSCMERSLTRERKIDVRRKKQLKTLTYLCILPFLIFDFIIIFFDPHTILNLGVIA